MDVRKKHLLGMNTDTVQPAFSQGWTRWDFSSALQNLWLYSVLLMDWYRKHIDIENWYRKSKSNLKGTKKARKVICYHSKNKRNSTLKGSKQVNTYFLLFHLCLPYFALSCHMDSYLPWCTTFCSISTLLVYKVL